VVVIVVDRPTDRSGPTRSTSTARPTRFFTKEPVQLTADDRAELQQVIDSIQIGPAG